MWELWMFRFPCSSRSIGERVSPSLIVHTHHNQLCIVRRDLFYFNPFHVLYGCSWMLHFCRFFFLLDYTCLKFMPSFWIQITCLIIGVLFNDAASIWEFAASKIRRRMGKELGIIRNKVLMEKFHVPNKCLPEDTEENYPNLFVTSRFKNIYIIIIIFI